MEPDECTMRDESRTLEQGDNTIKLLQRAVLHAADKQCSARLRPGTD